jgi:hypothetical protein
MRSLVVGLVFGLLLVSSAARAEDTLDAGLALADEMKQDKDGSQLDDHLTALKAHAGELAKLHKDHKKDKAVSAKLDAVEKDAKDALVLGAQAKKVASNKRLFPAADKKLKAKLAAYSAAATAANKALDKAAAAAAEKAAKADKAAVATPTPTPLPTSAPTEAAKNIKTSCKKIEFLTDSSGGKLMVRAVFLDARRKQSRELAKNNAPVTKADDYELAFTVKDKKNDWKVIDESYEWKETSAKSGAVLATSRKSSREPVKNDVLEVGAGPGDTITGKLSATIQWKNGAVEENDKEDCTFEIAAPK